MLLLPILATSQNEWLIGKTIENSRTYKARWLPDLGTLRSDNISKAFYAMSKSNGIADNIQFAWLGEAASKFRTSGNDKFFSKLYSTNSTNDATQTTDLNQPYLSGNIAPNERYCLSNPNGASRFITHPTISFAANEAWSVTTVLSNNFKSVNPTSKYCGTSSVLVGLYNNDSNRYRFTSNAGVTSYFTVPTYENIGKNTIITFSHSGTALSLYVNGIFKQLQNCASDISFDQILTTASDRYLNGKIYAHIIRSGALSQSQITSEYNFLRSIYPEIETVKIGSQDWATSNLDVVATPQGNVIKEVTANTNVEKITVAADRDFSSDTGFWTKETGVTIGGGTLNLVSVANNAGFYRNALLTLGKYYKITLTILGYVEGTLRANNGNIFTVASANGTQTIYFNCGNSNLSLIALETTTLSIDNVSIQEIGWAGSQELYDGIYAQTAGTVEQKTYDAVKAAAMWSYYNNDANVGAVYGKLYNWYAVKLLQLDIDAYNLANPTTPWGYRVPTQADFTTLQTTLGGASVAGGKMKKEGLNYWLTPNTGADNGSGFSALGSGFRSENGVSFNPNYAMFSTANETNLVNGMRFILFNNTASFVIDNYFKARGTSLRLIKTN